MILVFCFTYLLVLVAPEKRLLLHDDTDIARAIAELQADVSTLKSENANLKNTVEVLSSQALHSTGDFILALLIGGGLSYWPKSIRQPKGSTYIRWGRTRCPGNGTIMVYRGYAGGSQYNQPGGGSNNICLPEHPTFAKYTDTPDEWRGRVVGTEFESVDSDALKYIGYSIDDEDVPCALCKSVRTVVMIPGRTDCYPGWTEEYTGYLMSQYYKFSSNGDFVCVDAKPDFVAHGEGDINDHLLYFVEGRCGALPCPPYVNGRELACVVCSI